MKNVIRATASRARRISSAVIASKSLVRRASRSEKSKVASISTISGASSGTRAPAPGLSASATRGDTSGADSSAGARGRSIAMA